MLSECMGMCQHVLKCQISGREFEVREGKENSTHFGGSIETESKFRLNNCGYAKRVVWNAENLICQEIASVFLWPKRK